MGWLSCSAALAYKQHLKPATLAVSSTPSRRLPKLLYEREGFHRERLLPSPSPWPTSTPPEPGNRTAVASSSSWTASWNEGRQEKLAFLPRRRRLTPATLLPRHRHLLCLPFLITKQPRVSTTPSSSLHEICIVECERRPSQIGGKTSCTVSVSRHPFPGDLSGEPFHFSTNHLFQ
jgi:hypothetical protein